MLVPFPQSPTNWPSKWTKTNTTPTTDDMELDEFDPSWSEMPISPWDVQDNEFCRSMNPRGFVYPCCYKRRSQSQVNSGCVMGEHRAADG